MATDLAATDPAATDVVATDVAATDRRATLVHCTEKIAKIYPKIAQNGALINKISFPTELQIKI
jgi:hypothetical protein